MLKLQAPGIEVIGTANPVTGTAGNYGSYSQITASLGSDYYLTHVALYDLTSVPIYVQADIGVGSSGSEVTQTLIFIGAGATVAAPTPAIFALPAPLPLTASTRIAVKVLANNATQTIAVTLLGPKQANLTDATDSTISTNLDAAVSTRLATSSYTAPDNTTITAIDAKTTNLPIDPAATSDIPTAIENADELLDHANGIETGWTPKQTLRAIVASVAGKLAGAPAGPIALRNPPDTATRLTATLDGQGNRTDITYNV